MEKKFRITVEGKPYVVTVEDITADSHGVHGTYQDTAAVAISTPVAAPVAAPRAPTPSAPSATGAGDVVAPLGGVVQEILVSAGQSVNEGDPVVALEAMKMITKVVATRSGNVTGIAVKTGDPVDAGQVLLTIG